MKNHTSKNLKPILGAIIFACASTFSNMANAHMPYLYASGEISDKGGIVSLDASYVETYFVPEVAFDKGQFEIITPSGEKKSPDRVEIWKARTLGEHKLGAEAGTYRFSTGLRPGAFFRIWEIDGKRQSSRDPNAQIPEGAKIIADYQSMSMAETYISVARPNETALAARNQGLEIVAISNPTDLFVGEDFKFRILMNGEPLANHDISFTEAVSLTGEKPKVFKLTTDENGQATFRPDRPAHWVALVRKRIPAPAGAPVAEHGYTYTLTLRSLGQ